MRLTDLKWIALAQAGALLGLGCGDDEGGGKNGLSALLAVTEVAAGDDCANGGYSVSSGVDTNKDGELGEDEIESTQFICNGADGAQGDMGGTGDTGDTGASGSASLVAQRDLVVGDTTCKYGGVEITAGLDNGDGDDGVADDGILQSGEIDDTEAVCESRPLVAVKPVDPPAGPAGAYTIRTSGGNGSVTSGGNGGYFNMEMDSGSLGGHLKVFSTGVADASFTAPTVAAHLGAKPLNVTANLTIPTKPDADHTGVGTGDAHTHLSSTNVFIWNGTSDDTVTGISVAAGTTLTIEAQNGVLANVNLAGDFHNAGTVTTPRLVDTRSRANLQLAVDNFIGDTGSSIDLSGANGASGNPGGNAGSLNISAEDDDVNSNNSAGAIFNYGTFNTSGGDGDDGGAGSNVDLWASLRVVNTGAIDSTGGAGSVNAGATGGHIEIQADYGSVWNSGALTSSGGNGAVIGGNAGYIDVYMNNTGDTLNSGNATAKGGDVAAACAAGCAGGAGNYVEFATYAGSMRQSGNIDTRGGFGAAGTGGNGREVYLSGWGYTDGWESSYQAIGSVEVSGNIDTRGGDGASGGNGGYVDTDLDAQYVADNQEIIFYGYTDIDTSGGDGVSSGGAGGYFYMYNDYASNDGFPADYGPSGGCINYANLNLSGGDSETGTGGNGGYFDMETDYYYGFGTSGEVVINHGDVTNSGGDGAGGGNPGYVYLFAYNAMENHGAITSLGGDASAAAGDPGDSSISSPHVQMTCDNGPLVNTGAIDISAGNASGTTTTGGYAGVIEMYGLSVDNSGALTANGGDGTTTGGDGGGIFLYGRDDGTTNTGAFAVAAGDGATDGVAGQIFIDSLNVTP